MAATVANEHPVIPDRVQHNITTALNPASTAAGQSITHYHANEYIRMTSVVQAFVTIGVCCLILAAVVGNILTIAAYISDARLRSVYNFFIFNMSITDALIGGVSMPFYAVYTLKGFQWTFGYMFCKAWLVVDFTLCLESVLMMVLISVDRFILVTYPSFYVTKLTMKVAITAVSVSWALAFLLYSPAILGWNQWTGHTVIGHLECDVEFSNNFEFVTATAVLEFVIPLTCLCLLNYKIYMAIHGRRETKDCEFRGCCRTASLGQSTPDSKATETPDDDSRTNDETCVNTKSHSKAAHSPVMLIKGPERMASITESFSEQQVLESISRRHLNPLRFNRFKSIFITGKLRAESSYKNNKVPKSRSKPELKSAKFLASLVIVFLVCWCPYTVTTTVISLCSDSCINTTFYEILNWLLWSKSALNPLLYAINSSGYRKAFKKMFMHCKGITRLNRK